MEAGKRYQDRFSATMKSIVLQGEAPDRPLASKPVSVRGSLILSQGVDVIALSPSGCLKLLELLQTMKEDGEL